MLIPYLASLAFFYTALRCFSISDYETQVACSSICLQCAIKELGTYNAACLAEKKFHTTCGGSAVCLLVEPGSLNQQMIQYTSRRALGEVKQASCVPAAACTAVAGVCCESICRLNPQYGLQKGFCECSSTPTTAGSLLFEGMKLNDSGCSHQKHGCPGNKQNNKLLHETSYSGLPRRAGNSLPFNSSAHSSSDSGESSIRSLASPRIEPTSFTANTDAGKSASLIQDESFNKLSPDSKDMYINDEVEGWESEIRKRSFFPDTNNMMQDSWDNDYEQNYLAPGYR